MAVPRPGWAEAGRSSRGGGRTVGEVVRDLADGTDGARAHVNSHVLLDGDAQLLPGPPRTHPA